MMSNIDFIKLRTTCPHCQQLPSGKRCEDCRKLRRQIQHDRKAQGLCIRCGSRPIAHSVENYCQRCLDLHTRSQRRGKIKIKVFNHYGRKCTCCGATQNLTIDHIDPGLRRLEGDPPSDALYRLIIKKDFPPDYQVLCRACNSSKGHGPSCQLHTTGKVIKVKQTTITEYEIPWDRDMALLSAEEFMAKYT
jgi:hypothetical protein